MGKDPAFMFYTSDFLMGIWHMSFEDRGKYITLLSYMHQSGRLSEEKIKLLIGDISANLKSKFKLDESGLWYNVRLEAEMLKRQNFLDSCRVNGKKGGRPVDKKEKKETAIAKVSEEPVNISEAGPEKYPFDEFWKMYDKPTEKQNCENKWKKLHVTDKELIFQRLPVYIAATPDRQFRKNPLTYINRKIWLDELIPEPPGMKKKSAFKQLAETGSYE